MSSICSKNDYSAVKDLLQQKGIFDYFIFPDISWEPKGPRLARLIEEVQLRPQTVLFIDDNHLNRAEAAAMVPGLQVEDETFISRLLDDPRFVGKNDAEMARLQQYKLLESKKADRERAEGDNEAFLRSCDVRVFIDYDVEKNIDRAVELINRTNQLNYTKRRLSDDLPAAREELQRELRTFDPQAGLIRVIDNYGDYGYVGFFMSYVNRATPVEGCAYARLIHFCFSCRTLGMEVERWVYEFLRRPELTVTGEVLNDLSSPKKVDWIREIHSIDGEIVISEDKVAPKIIVYGGCEAEVISLYLKSFTDKIEVFGNYAANGLYARVNASAIALDICDRSTEEFANEAEILDLPLHLETRDFISDAEPGAIFVFQFAIDAGRATPMRHKTKGWMLALEPRELAGRQLVTFSQEELEQHIEERSAHYSEEKREHLRRAVAHMRENYEIEPARPDLIEFQTRQLMERIPQRCKAVFLLPHNQFRSPEKGLLQFGWFNEYYEMMRNIARDYPYVALVAVSEALRGPEDIHIADHIAREAYLRLALRIKEAASSTPGRSDRPMAKHRLLAMAARAAFSARKGEREREARDLVAAAFESFFFRHPSCDTFVPELSTGAMTPAAFIRNVSKSEEFNFRWQRRGE
jgi:FkbH-like protein